MGLLKKLFSKPLPPQEPDTSKIIAKNLMISQYAAYFAVDFNVAYKKAYVDKMYSIGIDPDDAKKLFDFEHSVCMRHDKSYMLNDDFTKMWLMDLKKPFLGVYWDNKDYIRDAKFLTIAELCKLIDEAEWHFYNSHEKDIPREVWAEIYMWRLKGDGGRFTVEEYLPMITQKQGVSMDTLQKIVNYYGGFLNTYKWS